MMTLISSSILIITAASIIGVQSTSVSQCTSVNASLPEVDVKNCTESPCVFYIGATGVMTMKFRAPRYLENITPQAVASVLGLQINYPLDQSDACDGIINTPCPLAANEYVEYTYGMSILELFPPISLSLEFSLTDLDKNGEAFECFQVDLQLVKP